MMSLTKWTVHNIQTRKYTQRSMKTAAALLLSLLCASTEAFVVAPNKVTMVSHFRTNAFVRHMLQPQNDEVSSPTIMESSVTDDDMTTMLPARQQWWDNRSLINSSVICGIAAVVFLKLSLLNHGVSRGWTAEEMAFRLPLDTWHAYYNALTDAPIATKAVTSATVYTIGDVISQKQEGTSVGDLDRLRILRSLLAGLVGHGPLSHVWYNVSDDFFTHFLHLTAWWSFVPKVALDQTVWGPIWNNTYILLLGLMKRDSLEEVFADMKRTTVPLITTGLKLWVPAHCVTYGLIPLENRLLWVDLVEIAWVTILASQAAGTDDAMDEQDTVTIDETTTVAAATVEN